MSPDATIRARAVTHRYGPVVALDTVEIDAPASMLVAVAGPSGSGKSTLLRLLAGLEPVQQGTIEVDGRDIGSGRVRAARRMRRFQVAFMFAEPSRNVLLARSVAANITWLARWRKTTVDVDELLGRFGLDGRGHSRITDLSGGEQQRLAVALTSVGDPPIVIADEPTSELDHENSARVIDALLSLAAAGRTVIVASHDDLVLLAAHRVTRLRGGRVQS